MNLSCFVCNILCNTECIHNAVAISVENGIGEQSLNPSWGHIHTNMLGKMWMHCFSPSHYSLNGSADRILRVAGIRGKKKNPEFKTN